MRTHGGGTPGSAHLAPRIAAGIRHYAAVGGLYLQEEELI